MRRQWYILTLCLHFVKTLIKVSQILRMSVCSTGCLVARRQLVTSPRHEQLSYRTNKWTSSWDFCTYHICTKAFFYSFLANSDFCHLLITFANDLDSKLFDTQIVFLEEFFLQNMSWEATQKLVFKTDYYVPRKHSTILSTFIKVPFVFKTRVLSIFEWPLKANFEKSQQTTKKHEKVPSMQRVKHICWHTQQG